jgi:hypothetical protein
VSRSSETKLPAKFFAVSSMPFTIPSPNNSILRIEPSAFSPQPLAHSCPTHVPALNLNLPPCQEKLRAEG